METDDPVKEDVIPSPPKKEEKEDDLNENGDIGDLDEPIPSPVSKSVPDCNQMVTVNDSGNHSEPESEAEKPEKNISVDVKVKLQIDSNPVVVLNAAKSPKVFVEKLVEDEETEKTDDPDSSVVNTRPKRLRKKKKHPDSPDPEEQEIKVTKSETPKRGKKKRKLDDEEDDVKNAKNETDKSDTEITPPKAKRAKKAVKEKPVKAKPVKKEENKTAKNEKKSEADTPKAKRKYSRKPKGKEPAADEHQMNGELSSTEQDLSDEVKSPKSKKAKKSPTKASIKERPVVNKSPAKSKVIKSKEKVKESPEKPAKKTKKSKKAEVVKTSISESNSGKENVSKKKKSKRKEDTNSVLKETAEDTDAKKSKKKPPKAKKGKKEEKTPEINETRDNGVDVNSGDLNESKSSAKEESSSGENAGHSTPSKEEQNKEEGGDGGDMDDDGEDGSAEDKPFNCPECKYRAKKKGQLRKHLAVHNIFQCAHCDFTATVRDNIEEHMRVNHPTRCGRKLCKKCNVLFRLDEIDEHEKQCTGEKKPWVCSECKKEFKFYCAMKTHYERWHTGKALPKYSCEECDFEAANKIALKQHVKENHKLLEKSVKCTECDSTFKTDSDMHKHRKKVHEKNKDKDEKTSQFPCDKCEKSYASQSSLRNHVATAHEEAAVVMPCDVNGCQEVFKSKSRLVQHKKSVHKIDPPKFKCTFAHCDLEFLKVSHLKRHEVTHTGERKYRCDWPDCGKAFRHADNLRVHYRRHTNEKPLKCDLCGASYRQKNGLKYHMEKAHGTACPPAKKSSSGTPNKAVKKEGASPKKKKEEEAAAVASSPVAKPDPPKVEQKAPDSSDSQSSAKDVYEFHDSDDEGLDLKMLPKTPLKSAGSPRLRPDGENKPFPTPFPEVPSPVKKAEDSDEKGKKKKKASKKKEPKAPSESKETKEPKEKKEKKSKSKKKETVTETKAEKEKEKEEVKESKPKAKSKKKKKKEEPEEVASPPKVVEAEPVEEPPVPSPEPEVEKEVVEPEPEPEVMPPAEEHSMEEGQSSEQETTEEYQDNSQVQNDVESGAGSLYGGENYEDQCDQWVNAPAPPQVTQDSDMEEEQEMQVSQAEEHAKESLEVSGLSDSLNMSEVAPGETPGPEDISQQYQDVQNRLDSGEEAYTEEIAKAARDLLGETSDHQSDVPDNVDLNPVSREVPVIQSPAASRHTEMTQPASVASSYNELTPDMNGAKYSIPPPPAYGYEEQPSYPSEMQQPPEKVPETLASPVASAASKYTYPGESSYSNPSYATTERGAPMSMDSTATTTYSSNFQPSSEASSYAGTAPAPTTTTASYTSSGAFMESPLYLTSRPTELQPATSRSLPPSAAPFATDTFSSRDFFGQYFQDPGTLPLTHPPLSQDQRLSYHAAAQQSSLSALQRSNADLLRRAATGSLMPPSGGYPSVTESLVGMNSSLGQTSQQPWMVPHDERSRSHWGQPSPIITAPEIDSAGSLSRNPYSCERPDYASFDPNASSQLNKRSEPTFPAVPQTVANPSEPRYDMASYMGSRSLPGSSNYGRSMPSASSTSKQLEEAYRHAAHITDYTRTLPQAPPPMADMYSRMGMNPAAQLGLDKYYYPPRDMYRSQHALPGSTHPFIPPTSTAAPAGYSERDYGRSAMYSQHAGAYSFMGDKQYLGATNKVPQGVGAPTHLPTDYLQHATPGAADPHMQDPYRRSVIYNMMPRYF